MNGKDATLHQSILSEIEGRIVSGEWPPGHRIPFEVDLAQQYGCSRMTVNKVLTQLAKAGLIERRKKSGSFVTQPQAQSAVLEIHDIKAEVQSLNLPYSYRVVARASRKAKAKAKDSLRLELATGTPLVEVACVHFAGTRPFCLEERLINLQTVPDASAESFETTAPGPWLLTQVPWTAAEHRIHASGAGQAEAEMLGIACGTACLVIERRTWSNAGPVTHVRFTYPGDRHALVARFSPAS